MKKIYKYYAGLAAIVAVFLLATVTTLFLSGPQPQPNQGWVLISETTTATVYNAVPSQCNDDPFHTASMYTIVPERIEQDRILAMERTMMAEYGIHYGDLVLIIGAGDYDGVWQVQDTMNKRFAGQHKIDLLVPEHIRHGKWKNVKVYKQNTYYASND